MQLDTSKKGLKAVFKDWHLFVLEYLSQGHRGTSRELYLYVNRLLSEQGETISRASIINFLNYLADEEELVGYTEETAKGGHRRRYFMGMNRREFVRAVMDRFVEQLQEIDALEDVGYEWPSRR